MITIRNWTLSSQALRYSISIRGFRFKPPCRYVSNAGPLFQEYLQLFHHISINTYSLSDILQHKIELPKDFRPLVYFTNYLKRGYYPSVLEDDFDVRLQQIINHTLESEIAAILSASRNNIEDYSLYIEEAG